MKIKAFLKQARKIRLSQSKKAQVKANLISFIDANPIGQEREPITQVSFFSALIRYKYVPVMALLIIMLGGGTSVASEAALPGSALYPVKTKVNERVKDLVNRSPEEKIALQARLIEERIREAEVLAEKEGLSEELASEIEGIMERRMAYLNQHIARVSPESAEETRERFYNRISRHRKLLSDIPAAAEADYLSIIVERMEVMESQVAQPGSE